MNNTDLYDNDVPVYFHIEDKIFDIACEGFEQFNVPQHMIRKITLPEPKYNIPEVHFGKKYMCLFDNEITTNAWFIYDTDAFACKEKGKMQWYDKLVSEPLSSHVCTMKRWVHNYNEKDFDDWVYGTCACVGTDFDRNMKDVKILYDLGKTSI